MVLNYFLYPYNVLSCISERFCVNFEDLLQVLLGKPASVAVIVYRLWPVLDLAVFLLFLFFVVFFIYSGKHLWRSKVYFMSVY